MGRSEPTGLSASTSPLGLIYRMYRFVLPATRRELRYWRTLAGRIPDPELRRQALQSLTSKQFHSEGGAVYASANLRQRHVLIPLIVAFQTISDYLDNLCDRSTSLDAGDFRQLHLAMLDAVTPRARVRDYYQFHPERQDGGYLAQLVRTCQACIRRLASYPAVQGYVRELVARYSALQVYKHTWPDRREPALLTWWGRYRHLYPQLRWNEFAAASGSTLGVFMLFLASTDGYLAADSAGRIQRAYFPHVCALHILMDYLIDREEDRRGGDLNLCSYYETGGIAEERIKFIIAQARADVTGLESPRFHQMIVDGLLWLYLSDGKVGKQPEVTDLAARLRPEIGMSRAYLWMGGMLTRRTW